jgi:O-antigen/teichoic acid export membrane protein
MLKTTSLLGGSKVITIVVSIVRNKIFAVILGPSGIGFLGVLNASIELGRVLFSFGLDAATVRNIAQNHTDKIVLNSLYRTSQWTGIVLGVASAIIFGLISPYLSNYFFGDSSKIWCFLVGAGALLFAPLIGVQFAFLQGIKQAKALAICQIVASVVSSILSIFLTIIYGINGAILSILVFSLASLIINRIFVSKFLYLKVPNIKFYDFIQGFRGLIILGSAFAINGIWLTLSNWLNISFLTEYFRAEDVTFQIGLFSAASMLGNFYINILISAMSANFYPQLISIANDKVKVKELLNHQTRLCMAIGVPVSIAMVITSPWLLQILYSKEFAEAKDVMRLLLFGMTIRFISCPIGFSLLACGSPRSIAVSEICMGATMISFSWIMIGKLGLIGVGLGLICANLVYLIGIGFAMKKKGVYWSPHTLKIVVWTILTMGVGVFLSLKESWFLSQYLFIIILAPLIVIHLLILKKDADVDLMQYFRNFRIKK